MERIESVVVEIVIRVGCEAKREQAGDWKMGEHLE